MRWGRPAKIAFIGSHGIRKTTAAHAFASTVQQAGRSVEYGRWTFVNLALVAEGYAQAGTWPPDVKYADLMLAAQRLARAERRGLWGAQP